MLDSIAAGAGRQFAPAARVGRDRAALNFVVGCRGESLPSPSSLRYAVLHTRMVAVALTVALSSCVVVAVAPVPGSETVRVTRNASEVSTCSAVGDIKVNASGSNARTEFRNAVVGFGGTVGLVTIGPAWEPVGGIAYRCP
jgi:hypothetical protein